MNTVTVMCRIGNGLLLTICPSWFVGHPLDLIEAEPVLLKPGTNEIDGRYWAAWLSDHADADVVTGRFVYEA